MLLASTLVQKHRYFWSRFHFVAGVKPLLPAMYDVVVVILIPVSPVRSDLFRLLLRSRGLLAVGSPWLLSSSDPEK